MFPEEERGPIPEPAQPRKPASRPRRGRRGGRGRARRPDQPRPPPAAESAPTQEMGGDAAAVQPRISPAPPARAHQGSAVNRAIEEVNHVVELLQRALEEMEEVLETLEFAERQKIDDEREIDSLRRALRQLHRPKEEERAQ